MSLETLKQANRLTEEAYLALKYLKGRVEKYLFALKEHNPEYYAVLYGRGQVDGTEKHERNWLLFELQELAEDLMGVIFEEEGELRRYYEELKDKKKLAEFSLVFKRLAQCAIECQLFNQQELLFDLISLSTEQCPSLISILAILGENYRISQAD